MVKESEVHSFLHLHCCRANGPWPMEYVCTPRSAWFQNRYIVEATKHIVLEAYSVYSELVKGVPAFQGIGGTCVSLEIKFLDNQSRGDYRPPFSAINPQSVTTSIDCLLIYCKSIDLLLSMEGESGEC